jgi:hypothetical protein
MAFGPLSDEAIKEIVDEVFLPLVSPTDQRGARLSRQTGATPTTDVVPVTADCLVEPVDFAGLPGNEPHEPWHN